MKKNKKKYVFLVLAILLVAAGSFITYSIYRTNLSGNGTITTSKWSVKVYKNSGAEPVANLNFGMNDIEWTTHNGKEGTIAPGDSGTITYTIDASGSQVDVAYTATIGTIEGAPEGLTATISPESGTIEHATGDNAMTQDLTLTITWTGTEDDESTKDEDDMDTNETELTIPVTLTVKQDMGSAENAVYLVSKTTNTIGSPIASTLSPTGVDVRTTPEAAMDDWLNWSGVNAVKPFFLKHVLNGNYEIEKSYIGFEIGGTKYYIQAGIDESETINKEVYIRNAKIIYDAFGRDASKCNNQNPYDSNFSDDDFECSDFNMIIEVDDDGDMSVQSDNSNCYIDNDGNSSCDGSIGCTANCEI